MYWESFGKKLIATYYFNVHVSSANVNGALPGLVVRFLNLAALHRAI